MPHMTDHNDIYVAQMASGINPEIYDLREAYGEDSPTLATDRYIEDVYGRLEAGPEGARELVEALASREAEASADERDVDDARAAAELVCEDAGIIWADEYPAALTKACERAMDMRADSLEAQEQAWDEEER